jgi:hypothetical protein
VTQDTFLSADDTRVSHAQADGMSKVISLFKDVPVEHDANFPGSLQHTPPNVLNISLLNCFLQTTNLPVLLSLQFVLGFQLKYHTQPKWNVVLCAAGTWEPPTVICLVWLGSNFQLSPFHLQLYTILMPFPLLTTHC